MCGIIGVTGVPDAARVAYLGLYSLQHRGQESAGLTIEGHVPEKDGILADLLAAEMTGATGKPLEALSEDLRKEIGPFFSTRIDLPFTPEEGQALKARKAAPPERFAGRQLP